MSDKLTAAQRRVIAYYAKWMKADEPYLIPLTAEMGDIEALIAAKLLRREKNMNAWPQVSITPAGRAALGIQGGCSDAPQPACACGPCGYVFTDPAIRGRRCSLRGPHPEPEHPALVMDQHEYSGDSSACPVHAPQPAADAAAVPTTAASVLPFGNLFQVVGFLRSCIHSGELLSKDDEARIDLTVDLAAAALRAEDSLAERLEKALQDLEAPGPHQLKRRVYAARIRAELGRA